MVQITIKHDDGRTYTYEDVVAFDFYDKETCEALAGRNLTANELKEIEVELNDYSELTSDAVREVINSVTGE